MYRAILLIVLVVVIGESNWWRAGNQAHGTDSEGRETTCWTDGKGNWHCQ